MKKTIAVLFPILSFFFSCQHTSEPNLNQVNSLLGNRSFVLKFGKTPDSETSEMLRIRTHLQFVEEKLRAKNTDHLSDQLKQRRSHMLDLLREYQKAGKFPSNNQYPGERKPCFIDESGNICAVGYLIEKTAGRDAAEAINKKYQYERLADIKDPVIDNWVAESGLSYLECRMIQPEYHFESEPQPIDPPSPPAPDPPVKRDTATVHDKLDRYPEFKSDAYKNFLEFVRKHAQYPEKERGNCISGTVILSFIQDIDGMIKNIKVKKSVIHSLDIEAKRVLELSSGMWTIGTMDGKTVPVRMYVRIPFEIER